MTLSEFYNQLKNGLIKSVSPEIVQLMNDEAIRIVGADSTLSMTDQDIEILRMLIDISNILYNNTTMAMLPLDDGIYDMLMIIVKKYIANYPVGARPVSFENKAGSQELGLVDPFVFHDSRLDTNLFGEDFKRIKWGYEQHALREPDNNIARRFRDTAHNYPELVGTLDKCKFVLNNDALEKGMLNAPSVEILERDFFGKHMAMGLYGPNDIISIIAELKYDGMSIEADVSNKILGARSRGDTNDDVATDYTRALYGYQFPNEVQDHEAFGMKFEAILNNATLRELNYVYGKSYKNARNAVQGVLGGSDSYRWRDFITLVPLAASIAPAMGLNRAQEIEFLNTYYIDRQYKIYYQVFTGNYISVLYQIREFMKAAEYARPSMPFLYDGIVISYMDQRIINALGRQNSVNKWQMAVKFESLRKETIFLGYQYTVGQNGVITPMIYYKPIEFYGCIHNHSSGHSFARFNDLKLRYGDIITVEYRNDVMPYVVGKVDCEENDRNRNPIIEFPVECPSCGSMITLTDKSATCSNPNCPERAVARVTNMLAKLGFKGFSEATVRKLNISSLTDLLSVPYPTLVEVLKEKTADNFEVQRKHLLQDPIYDYKLVGSLGFTDVAEISWQVILANIKMYQLCTLPASELYERLIRIRGIGERIAGVITTERSTFANDIALINGMPNVIHTHGASARAQIRFTGCRDHELMEFLVSKGYDCRDTGVTKNTKILIVPHDGYTSAKVSRAPVGCRIIALDMFRQNPIEIIEDTARMDIQDYLRY